MVAKLIVTNPDKRLHIHQLKKHPFFSAGKGIDWKAVTEAKLRMPVVNHRPINHSKLPFSYNDSDDDEADYGRGNNSYSDGDEGQGGRHSFKME